MSRAIHGAPAHALRQALEALAGLSFWIAWTADPDLAPEPFVSARCMRDAATALRKAACLLDQAADRADPPPDTGELPVATPCAPADLPGALASRSAGSESPAARPGEAETSPVRAGAGGPERLRAAPVPSSTETSMNHIAPQPEAAIREIPLSCLALAPENVRKTPPDAFADHQLRASIAAHGLLENLVARADEPNESGAERFAVVAGGRRLAALKALAEDGTLDADHPVPCKIAANGDAGELSLAENMIRIAMHPADQVVAFSTLAASGVTAAAIAARFGVTERIVEQRLRLGNAAPELLDAYRVEAIDLETLKAFAVTTDHERQRAVWEQVSSQGYRPSAWQVKRMLTEERVPAGSAMARFVGVDAYEAAGGPVLRDLFADEHENGVWLEDPALLNDLAMKKLQSAADELATRWKWAESLPEVDWSATARFGRIHPEPGEPTDAEKAEIETLRNRHDEIATMEEHEWTDELVAEAEGIDERLDAIEAEVESRARFRPEDFAMAGCIATIGRDGSLQVIQGLVRPDDIPKDTGAAANGEDSDAGGDGSAETGRVNGPAISTPLASPVDPRAKAREEAGVGIGLADDLRAVRTALIKAHLAQDFEAAFDLVVFQMVRAVFARGYTMSWHALDIAFNETADRPTARMNDEDFAAWSPGEAMLADWSHLPFEWMEGDHDAACFAALRALPRADKEKLFAAAVARTVKGQLAFEHDARPELEATVARLDIDFAKHIRPTAAMLWSRIKKSRILDIARETFGAAWTSARSKYKKAKLAETMETAFAAGHTPVGLGATAHAAALAWAPPGFAAFDVGGSAGNDTGGVAAAAEAPANPADASEDATAEPDSPEKPRTTSVVESIDSPAVAERLAAARAARVMEEAGESGTAPQSDAADNPQAPAHGNGHAAPVQTEGEAGPEPVNGRDGDEEPQGDSAIGDAMDARTSVQPSGRVNGHAVGDDALDIPEFLRRVH